jgi:hypothetical protein
MVGDKDQRSADRFVGRASVAPRSVGEAKGVVGKAGQTYVACLEKGVNQ